MLMIMKSSQNPLFSFSRLRIKIRVIISQKRKKSSHFQIAKFIFQIRYDNNTSKLFQLVSKFAQTVRKNGKT